RNADDVDVSRLSARSEDQVLVFLSTWHVRLEGGFDVAFREPARCHQIFDRLRGTKLLASLFVFVAACGKRPDAGAREHRRCDDAVRAHAILHSPANKHQPCRVSRSINSLVFGVLCDRYMPRTPLVTSVLARTHANRAPEIP